MAIIDTVNDSARLTPSIHGDVFHRASKYLPINADMSTGTTIHADILLNTLMYSLLNTDCRLLLFSIKRKRPKPSPLYQ